MRTHRCFTLNDRKRSPTNCFPSRNPLLDAYLTRWFLGHITLQFYLLKMKRCAAHTEKSSSLLLGTINNSSSVLRRGPRMSFLSCCSKDIFLIWRHLKRFLKYVFMYYFETKWVSVWMDVLYHKPLEDRNQVGLLCVLGYLMQFGWFLVKIIMF